MFKLMKDFASARDESSRVALRHIPDSAAGSEVSDIKRLLNWKFYHQMKHEISLPTKLSLHDFVDLAGSPDESTSDRSGSYTSQVSFRAVSDRAEASLLSLRAKAAYNTVILLKNSSV